MAIWLITGASRGLGEEFTRTALAHGHSVIAGVRDPEAARPRMPTDEKLLLVAMDVTDPAQVEQAVQAGFEVFGRIDVLVNNAGHGVLGTIEEVSDAETLGMFDVNVFGAQRVIRAVLPIMRRQQSGRIFNISSGGGFAASPSHGLYAATKFALEAITEALNVEVKPFGIHATIIEPGAFRTDFFSGQSIKAAALVLDEYGGEAVRARFLDVDGRQPGNPRKAAKALVMLSELDDPPLRVQFGKDSLARVEGKLVFVAGELDKWRSLATSLDFDDADPTFVDPGQVSAR